MENIDKDKMMWIGIRSGLLGVIKAISYTTSKSPALGIALSALGRIVNAIETRWDLKVSDPSALDYDQSMALPKEKNAV